MAKILPQFGAQRARTYVLRLPLFTRSVIIVIILVYIASIRPVWNLQQLAALIPNELNWNTMYRTNTFPLIHAGLLHMVINTVALTPLLERFESEHGTLTTLALFMGPLSTIPAIMYALVERTLLHMNTPIMGASIWVFTLLAMEAMKTYKSNPHFAIGDARIPTWITPFVLVLFVSVLVPNISFLGHVCGLAFGYGWGLGYLKFLAPPERLLRWVEAKMDLLSRLPHYVSVDQKTYGRYGVLPSSNPTISESTDDSIGMGFVGSIQRLGP